jgi:dihydrofolate reductase
MGNVVVTQFMSVDGVIEDPGGAEGWERGGWAFSFERGPEGDQFKYDETMAADALLLGRVTWEGFADAWPARTGDFADKFNSMPKHVVSSTLADGERWANTSVISGDVPGAVEELKRTYERDILVNGSARLVGTLAAHGLVDEYRLMVFPTVLGTGKRLFPDGTPATSLRLAESRPAGETLILFYRPK